MYVRVRRDAHQDLAGDQVVSNASSNDQENYNNIYIKSKRGGDVSSLRS